MLSKTLLLVFVMSATLVIPAVSPAGQYDGTVKIGGIVIDEDAGDLSAVQETYNLYEGFSFAQINIGGRFNPKTYFRLNLTDINLDNRKGRLDFSVPGRFKLYSRYDQNRQVFDPNRVINSFRKDWHVGAWYTPVEWCKLTADYGYQTRNGLRLGYPLGTESNLGTGYDFGLHTGFFEAEVRKDSRSLAVTYDLSSYGDNLDEVKDRFGYVLAARFRSRCYFTDKITHLVRGAVGERSLTTAKTDFTLSNFLGPGR
jgi:hypothetical protein